MLVFALMRRLLMANRLPAEQRPALIASGIAAALWLLHPIQLLPVLHVVQRMTSLSALFLLAAVWLHISAREQGGRAGLVKLIVAWVILWPLSFLSKETGALFPVFVLAWELIVRRSTVGHLDRFARGFAMLMGLVLLAAMAYVLSPRGQWLWAGYELRGFSLAERVLTEGRVLWFYLGLMLLPRLEAFGLYHDDIALSTSLFTPWTTLPALLGLAALIWLAWWLRRRAPLVSFGIAWFFIGHALESTVLPLELAHEHRNYLPLVWPAAGRRLGAAASAAKQGRAQNRGRGAGAGRAGLLSVCHRACAPTSSRSTAGARRWRRSTTAPRHGRSTRPGGYWRVCQTPAQANSPTYSFALRHYEMAGELDPQLQDGLAGHDSSELPGRAAR